MGPDAGRRVRSRMRSRDGAMVTSPSGHGLPYEQRHAIDGLTTTLCTDPLPTSPPDEPYKPVNSPTPVYAMVRSRWPCGPQNERPHPVPAALWRPRWAIASIESRPVGVAPAGQQRVALARALAVRPRVLLLDEPFSALDADLHTATRRAVRALLDDLAMTTVFVTHDREDADAFADRVTVLEAHPRVP